MFWKYRFKLSNDLLISELSIKLIFSPLLIFQSLKFLKYFFNCNTCFGEKMLFSFFCFFCSLTHSSKILSGFFLAEDEIIALNGIPSNFEFSLKVIKSERESFLIRFPFILILVFSSIKSSSSKDFCNEQLTVNNDSTNISFIFTRFLDILYKVKIHLIKWLPKMK